MNDIQRSDVFAGAVGNFARLDYGTTWGAVIHDSGSANSYWDAGETLEIEFQTDKLLDASDGYFQFVLPNGVWRSSEFTLN